MSGKRPSEIAAEERRARQEAMLKANLKRRKDQARARRMPGDAAGTGETGPEAEPSETPLTHE